MVSRNRLIHSIVTKAACGAPLGITLFPGNSSPALGKKAGGQAFLAVSNFVPQLLPRCQMDSIIEGRHCGLPMREPEGALPFRR